MSFLDPTNSFRWVLPTETDANSPITEELMSQSRENTETSILSTINTGLRAKVATGGVGTTTLTIEKIDAGDLDWFANDAQLLTMIIRTGVAIGQPYTVTSNTALVGAGTATVTVTGADFATDGIVVGDELMILYNISRAGHTHNGVDSKPIGVSQMVWDMGSDTYTHPGDILSGTPAPIAYPFYFRYEIGMRGLIFSVATTLTASTFPPTTFQYISPFGYYIRVPAQRVHDTDGTYLPATTQVTSPWQSCSVTAPSNATYFIHNQTSDNQCQLSGAGLEPGLTYEAYLLFQCSQEIPSDGLTISLCKGYAI